MQAIYHRAPKYAPKRQTVAPRRLNIRQSTDVYKHPASMTDPINIDSKDEILDQVPEEQTTPANNSGAAEETKTSLKDKFKALSVDVTAKPGVFKFVGVSSPLSITPESTKFTSSSMSQSKILGNESQATPFEILVKRLTKLQLNNVLPNAEPTKHSEKTYGLIKGFGICTNQGLVRNYNEDRVSILLNIHRISERSSNISDYWPQCSLFGVFDGHGGSKCVDYLRNNLHNAIVKSKYFPDSPQEALREGFERVERGFIEESLNQPGGTHDKSGSCALVLLIVDDTLYICNLGDSRAVMSQQSGNSIYALTRDHKPSDPQELRRVIDGGGKVYQNVLNRNNNGGASNTPSGNGDHNPLPCRILPGKLSVSRAFGDVEAKLPQFGGNPNVLIAKPEITKIKLNHEHDFLVLGCDGIYDKLSNEDITKIVWDTMNDQDITSYHQALGAASENILKKSLLSKSFDNVTAIVLGFSNLESHFNSIRAISQNPSRKGTMVTSPSSTISRSALVDRTGERMGFSPLPLPLPLALNTLNPLSVPHKLKKLNNQSGLENNKLSLTDSRTGGYTDESRSLSPANKDLLYSEASPKGYLPIIKGVKSSSNMNGKMKRFS